MGVVLSGGGARGAYEAGALVALSPVLEERGEWPEVFSGGSVGAINALTAAGLAHLPFEEQRDRAVSRWREVVKPNVFRSLVVHLPRLLARYSADLLVPGQGRVHALLDPAPLERHLPRWIDFDAIEENVRSGRVRAAAAIAAGTYTGHCTAFWSGSPDVAPESHTLRYVRTRLRVDHVRAATAIPILFPSVHLEEPDAEGWYLDGSTRLRSPMEPALALGAERLILIGTGSFESPSARDSDKGPEPTVADAAATALHAMAVDALRDDARRLPGSGRPHIAIAPPGAGEIGKLATAILRDKYRSGAGRIREMALIDRLLGGDSPLHGELVSFLLFDEDFIEELLAMGRRDALRWLDEHPDVWAG